MQQEVEEKDSAGENIPAKFFDNTFTESGSEEGIEEGREEEEEVVEEEEEEVNGKKALAKSLNLEIATFLQKLPASQETIVFEKQ